MVAVAHPDPPEEAQNHTHTTIGSAAHGRVHGQQARSPSTQTLWACRSTWTPTNSTGTRTIPGSHFFSPRPRMSAFDLSQ